MIEDSKKGISYFQANQLTTIQTIWLNKTKISISQFFLPKLETNQGKCESCNINNAARNFDQIFSQVIKKLSLLIQMCKISHDFNDTYI